MMVTGANSEGKLLESCTGTERSSPLNVQVLFACLLAAYLVAGLGWLGFARSPWQVLLTIVTSVIADWLGNRYLRNRGSEFPWSGLITGLGLSLLLNFGSHPWLPVWPALLAISSKYIFTARGRHVFNPGLFGLIAGMALSGGRLSPAPAYQWGGSWMMGFLLAGLALVVAIPRIKRAPLLISFLCFYSLQTALRAWLMRHHLPPEALVLGAVGSPAFFLFAFYMLIDPATSPKSAKGQVALALAVTLVDLVLHFKQSYSTLFPSLFLVQGIILIWQWIVIGCGNRERSRWRSLAEKMAIGGILLLPVVFFARDDEATGSADFSLARVEGAFPCEMGTVLEDVDPRIAHVAKWVFSVGDAVAIGDVNGDGREDVFLTYPLKKASDRAALFLNQGEWEFEKADLPEVSRWVENPKEHGLPSCPVFADYDNDGDQDLFLGMGFGQSLLFRNVLTESGQFGFEDVTNEAGITGHMTCVAAVFFDADGDGDLDLLAGNAMNPHLAKYENEVKLNPFALPEDEYEGDRRMFHFMHESWHKAENGGENVFYRNRGDGTFQRVLGRDAGMPETHWTLAFGVADFNRDGKPDVYAASDFGPDDLYLNQGDGMFRRHEGRWFGEVGRDTYKGMNASVADFNRDGFADVYVSNVHAPMQAEGSLLWITDVKNGLPVFKNEAVRRGALNEHRFGWGAAAGDLDLNGWVDLVQANGMVDDSMDRKFPEPRDYWYVNARLARTGPEVHAYADQWADMRGYSIWGFQRNRVLLNRGGLFEDAAVTVGLGAKGNARGIALADLDNDGDLDVVTTHQFGEAEMLRNDLSKRKRWIGFEVRGDGKQISRDGTGTKLEINVGGKWQTAWVQNVSGFSAQSSRRILFGLDDFVEKITLTIHWPDGTKEIRRDLSPGVYHRVEEP